jgi:flagellar L-ring protein precursor FlgH
MKKRSPSHSKLLLSSVCLAATVLPLSAQSLWKDNFSASMVSDKRGHAVGDILTIVVQESNTASKDNTTKTSKTSGIDASITSFLYPATASGLLTKKGQLPAMKIDSQNNFTGGGQINNSEKISAQIAVRIIDVLPNNNLVIEGTRQTSFAGESQEAILHGVVRLDDVQGDNTVFSYNVADATIRYVSKGAVSDSQNKSWFTKIWDKVSPF